MPTQSQTLTGATAGTASASSEEALSTAGSQTTQPTNADQVDTGRVEDNGNSDQSDAGNGSDSGSSERQRPTRAERRISELNKQISELRSVQGENERLKQLLNNPIAAAQINMPDRAGAEVTPEQYKGDLVNAADQLVKLRLGQVVGEMQGLMTRQQSNERTLGDYQYVREKYPALNPESSSFDPKLDKLISKTFQSSYRGDPNYSLRDLVGEVMELRGDAEVNRETATEDATRRQKAQSAIRGGGSGKNTKAPEQMSADELYSYIKAGGR